MEYISDACLICDGIKFYKDSQGYWLSENINRKVPKRLHVYMWEKHNGKVPKGYHIHHKDFNKDNNNISNLEIMDSFCHISLHANMQDKEKLRQNMIENVIPAAAEWHGSEEGIEWHKEHYKKYKHLLHKREYITCLECGKRVKKVANRRNKFCSNNCKSNYRRKSGVDDITVSCEHCGKTFMTNKYSSARFCSKECREIVRNENSKNRERQAI